MNIINAFISQFLQFQEDVYNLSKIIYNLFVDENSQRISAATKQILVFLSRVDSENVKNLDLFFFVLFKPQKKRLLHRKRLSNSFCNGFYSIASIGLIRLT